MSTTRRRTRRNRLRAARLAARALRRPPGRFRTARRHWLAITQKGAAPMTATEQPLHRFVAMIPNSRGEPTVRITSVGAVDEHHARIRIREVLSRPGRFALLRRWIDDGEHVVQDPPLPGMA